MSTPDFIVVGGGSGGAVAAARLAELGAGRVTVLEAGPSHRHPLVSMPFGLIWLMGSKRDWQFKSAPLAGGRRIGVPRGKMLGGSGSINSMVWFRGRAADFDGWARPGWSYSDVAPHFEAVEARLKPATLVGPHPLTRKLSGLLGGNAENPTPDYESAGVFRFNLVGGRRNSAANAFLDGADVTVRTGAQVDRLIFEGDRAAGVRLIDGTEIRAAKGVVLAAGSIASPAILLRSGIGPSEDLSALGIDTRHDAPGVGANLHDHPAVGAHFEGAGSGYGLEAAQLPAWAAAPFRYLLNRGGRLTSPTVEGGAFFNARGDGPKPDVQSHFIPFKLDTQGRKVSWGAGYFADVCLCRPKSRGRLRLAAKDPKAAPEIDLNLLAEDSDLETLAHGFARLRRLLDEADFGPRRAREVLPGRAVEGHAAIREMIRARCGTAYHPVGTLSLGGPVSDRLAVKGADGLWVADASVMPQVTSGNTNAPTMMIGHRAADFIAEDCR
ncbi:MAG: GMC family oxidoreductase N-terminal domain-containing protein [Pseudomonadota bacterium]